MVPFYDLTPVFETCFVKIILWLWSSPSEYLRIATLTWWGSLWVPVILGAMLSEAKAPSSVSHRKLVPQVPGNSENPSMKLVFRAALPCPEQGKQVSLAFQIGTSSQMRVKWSMRLFSTVVHTLTDHCGEERAEYQGKVFNSPAGFPS